MFKLVIYFGSCVILSIWAAPDDSRNARILDSEFENDVDGSYRFSYKTSDGIERQESAELIPSIHDESQNVASVKGSFSYTGPDGVVYTVKYTADESGFHPEGDHFVVPPFVPWVKGQPVDDGRYRPENQDINKGSKVSGPARPPKQKSNEYTSGERILDTVLTTQRPVTQKYLPPFEKENEYSSGENILDTFRVSNRPTTEYLPPVSTEATPTPHPEILFHSTSKPFSAAASQLDPVIVRADNGKLPGYSDVINPELRRLIDLL
ncbi:uncharacterized protein LOC132696600 [Cylas formicarius]|uniref:uncharacterized protein LOC132696600 n=1 Tax=Cylas formicarius TaxID=197179 RepID=UPI00295866B2|nr:uncharacterized protein LOC132696600 [Cylas formicarius]